MTRKVELPNIDHWVAEYERGVSLKKVAEQAGVSRPTMERKLREQGVILRSASEAERLKWQRIKETPGGVERQLSAAWAACDAQNASLEERMVAIYRSESVGKGDIASRLGTSRSNVGRILRKNGIVDSDRATRRAAGRARTPGGGYISTYERELMDAMASRGVSLDYQTAIGDINVDFTVGNIVIELERRSWGNSQSITRERIERIFGAGYFLLVAYIPRRRRRLPGGGRYTEPESSLSVVADQLVAWIEMLRNNPSLSGQYGVVGRDPQRPPRAGGDLAGFTRIVPPDRTSHVA